METRVLIMQLAYLLSAVLFILGLKRLSHPDTTRGGNRLAAIGMLLAIAALVLFATHYHELTDLAQRLDRLQNRSMAVKEWRGDILFLHRVVDGTADRSYGIHVARLAGVPEDVCTRAETVLANLERHELDMVVLSVGLEPQPDATEVARMFGVGCSSKGFIIERHAKLDPVATMTDGVFAAGATLGPRDIPTSVSNGAAAAATIAARTAGRSSASPRTAEQTTMAMSGSVVSSASKIVTS